MILLYQDTQVNYSRVQDFKEGWGLLDGTVHQKTNKGHTLKSHKKKRSFAKGQKKRKENFIILFPK
jgi:hypothetical protein